MSNDETAAGGREPAPTPLGMGAVDGGALPVAPSMAPAIESAGLGDPREPREYEPIDRRTVYMVGLAVVIAIAAGLAARLLTCLLGLVTTEAFYGRFSTAFVSPGASSRPAWALVLIPVIGALLVGVMARYGSAAIRGHGIPEVMERVLFGESRIPARVLLLKPLSAAVAIGTGGPFGAEGPIIATGGALGSLAGQFLHVTADERKTLLAAGAAAGMAATFGSPVSAVLLAVELLLFEYRPRSLIPVALAAAVATAVRAVFEGTAPVFGIGPVAQPGWTALAGYAVLGVFIGAVASAITRVTYGIEGAFERLGERLGVHWMWWPCIGAVVVGVVGVAEPRTLGVGYDNITGALTGSIAGSALLALVILKFISWSVYLGSGTSGGTLAPLFTIGGGLGAWIGARVAEMAPSLGMTASVAGLVGMAAIFAGASHALLTSIVFAFETTRQPLGLLPLLAGCTSAYLVSLLASQHSIMTLKLARRGTPIRPGYAIDHLSQTLVRDVASVEVVTLDGDQRLDAVRGWLESGAGGATHQGFPVLDAAGELIGVVTRRDLLDPARDAAQRIADIVRRAPVVVYEDSTLRDAADQMVLARVGRLPVVQRGATRRLVGIISRSDLLSAHASRLVAERRVRRVRRLVSPVKR
jgi:H+/Cl- antiporter ClcA/predicted transcriptional regulator